MYLKKYVCLVCLMMMVFIFATNLKAQERETNVFGAVCLLGLPDSTGASVFLDYFHDMVGDWGMAAKIGDIDLRTNWDEVEKKLILYRAKKIIPLFHAQLPETGDKLEEDGTFKKSAAKYAQMFAELKTRQLPVPYIELMNEVNAYWPAKTYARWLYDFATAVHQANPDIKVCSAGMAGNGADYYDEMLTYLPELKDVVDVWNLHPYCANHPPDYTKDGYTVQGYKWTLKVLEKHGVKNPKFIFSELGYELGDGKDTTFPRINEYNRAQYITDAYVNYFIPDNSIIGTCYFTLWDLGGGWNAWDLVKNDGTPTQMYNALKTIPKTGGKDWLPRGKAVLKGKITDDILNTPVDRVYVWTFPGYYATETDKDGIYEITGVPAGKYKLAWWKDGYICPSTQEIEVTDVGTLTNDITVKRIGLINGTMDSAGTEYPTVPQGWVPVDGKPHPEALEIDTKVKRTGPASLRMKVVPGGFKPTIWVAGAYNSALKDWVYSMEVWIKTDKLVRGNHLKGMGKGISITLQITNVHAETVSRAEVVDFSTGTTGWHPVTLSLVSPPLGRRLRVDIGVDAESGTVWVDDVFVHYGTLPLPSNYQVKKETVNKTSMILGFIKDSVGRPIERATVCTQPGNYWAVSDKNGLYNINEVPTGKYTINAFYKDFESKRTELVFDGIERWDISFGKVKKTGEIENTGFEHFGPEPAYTPGWEKWGAIDGILEQGKTIFTDTKTYKGTRFLHSGSGSNTKNGGVYQVIGVNQGKKYRLSAWIRTKQVGGQPGDTATRIGIDSTGGEIPQSKEIEWTKYETSEDVWKQITIDAIAQQPVVTIFLEFRQLQGNTWNANWLDEVELKEVE